jgi:hypothetical protein
LQNPARIPGSQESFDEDGSTTSRRNKIIEKKMYVFGTGLILKRENFLEAIKIEKMSKSIQ